MKTLFVLLFLVSCSTNKVVKPKDTSITLPTIEVVEDNNASEKPSLGSEYGGDLVSLPSATGKFTVKIVTQKYNPSQQAKVDEAAKYIKSIFNSLEYKQEVLGHTYQGKQQFVDNRNLTNEEIYFHLMSGAEALNLVINYQMDVTLKMYYSRRNTVGYTYPSDPIVYTNSKFHNNFDACRVASNVTHEWTHKMGFGHDSERTARRNYSVPYAHNSIIERLCPLAKQGKLTQIYQGLLPLVDPNKFNKEVTRQEKSKNLSPLENFFMDRGIIIPTGRP